MRLLHVTTRVFLLTAAIFIASPAQAQNDLQPVPVAQGFVADTAGVLPAEERARISELLRSLNQEKGSQLGVVIVTTTDPESIEDFAQRVFTTWKLGRAGVDDGVLLVLALNNRERRMRIHVGYGLEGAIPDAIAKRILAEQVRPALEKSGPAEAINTGVNELLARMYKADVAALAKARSVESIEVTARLMMGTFAQIPLFAFAAYLLTKRMPIRLKFAVGIVFGILTAALYVWVAGESWLAIVAAVWLVIPGMVAWKNRERLSETAWAKPRDGIAKPGSRGVSRKALRRLQGAAAIPAIAVAALGGAFSSGMGMFIGAIWLIFALLLANALTRVQPSTGGARHRGSSDGNSSSDDWISSGSGGNSSDSSSSDSGGGDSGGGGSSE